jgi:hypothetical protein
MSFAPKPKKVAYVVFIGRIPGIYESWPECNAQVHGFEGARFKGYTIYEDAIAVWDAFEEHGKIAVKQAERKEPSAPAKARIHKRVDPAITARARRLVSTSINGQGAHTTECARAACSYPSCNC